MSDTHDSEDITGRELYDRIVSTVRHNDGAEPLGMPPASVAGLVSQFTGRTQRSTVRHNLQRAVEEGDLVVYIDWSGRRRYVDADPETMRSIVLTEDLELRGAAPDALRSLIGAENTSDDPDRDLIERVLPLIQEAEDGD